MSNSATALAAALALLAAGGGGFAQERGGSDEAALFGEGSVSEAEGLVTEAADGKVDGKSLLLESETTEIGGRFRFKTTAAWDYDGLQGPFGSDLVNDSLAVDLGALVFLDARPSTSLRVFAKSDIAYPFGSEGGARGFDEVFAVKELFSEFSLADRFFFRAGKQTINWGVGRYFSPADLLNITEIDSEDPDAELEGPIALKIQAPLGAHNVYLYTVFEDADAPDEPAVAPKVEFVLGDTELGLGAYYRRDHATATMATVTFKTGDWGFFGEAVLSYGSNRTFVVEDGSPPAGLETETDDDGLYPSGTVGFSYSYVDDLSLFDLTLTAQYLYNGEGYEDPDLLRRNATALPALVASGAVAQSDLAGMGRHYAAVNLAWAELLDTDFSAGLLWLANLSDGSGALTPSIGWAPTDELSFTLKTAFRYGEDGGEYSRNGESFGVSIVASFGTGSF